MSGRLEAVRQRTGNLKPVGQQIDSTTVSLFLTLGIAFGLRWFRLSERSLWVDEFYSVSIRGQYPFWQLLLAQDPHPPFYYLVLGSWMELFGSGPVAVRSLSAVFGVCAVAGIYLVGRELRSRRAGLYAAILMTVSPLQVQFAQTARMYSLLVAVAAVSFAAYARILHREDTGIRPYFIYLIASVAMVYTHVFGVALVAIQNVYTLFVALVSKEKQATASLVEWGRLQALVAMLSLPWLANASRIVLRIISGDGGSGAGYDVSWINTPTLETVSQVLLTFGGALLNYPMDTHSDIVPPLPFAVTAVLLGLCMYMVFTAGKQLCKNREAPEIMAFVWFIGPIGGAFVASHILFPIFSLRFMIVASAGCYLLAGFGLDALTSTPVRILLIGFVIAGLLMSLNVYYDTGTTEKWDHATEHIENRADSGALILVVPVYANTSVEYYLGSDYQIKGVSPGGDSLESATGERVWLVSRYPSQADQTVAALNDTHVVGSHRSFGSIQVYRMDTRVERDNSVVSTGNSALSTTDE